MKTLVYRLALIALATAVAAGCSKKASRSSGNDGSAASGMPSSKDFEQAASNLKKTMPFVGTQAGNAMEAMSKVVAQSENVTITPVDFRKLKALLPDSVADLKRKSLEGQKVMEMSEATAEYSAESGNTSFSIKITDPGNMRGTIAASTAASLSIDMDKESDNGYERNVNFQGYRAHEQMTGQSGEMTLLVGDRFLVEAHGYNIKADQLKAAVGSLPLKKLEAMKDEGVEKVATAK